MIAGRWPDFLAVRAVSHADHPALIAGSTFWTFAELNHRVDATAGRLAASGVRAGDRIALLAGNSPGWVTLAHAAGRAGAVLVPLNTRLSQPELAFQLRDSGATLLIHDFAHAEVAAALSRDTPGLAVVGFDGDGLDRSEPIAIPKRDGVAGDEIRNVIFTSGTTGQPKGALLTSGNFASSAIASALHLGHQRDDCWLAALPLYHVGGLSILMRSIVCGVTVVLHERFDPAEINQAIDEQRVTLISVVAAMLPRLLDERGERPYPASLRCVLLGGGPAPSAIVDECIRRGVPVAPTYGMTETTSQVTTLLPGEVASRPTSSGRPLPLTSVRIEREGEVLPPREVGEIIVVGPTVTPGYAGRAAGNERILADGGLRTGDIGRVDEQGFLYVLDRRDDLIISGGENVYPAEVEAVLLAHPAVDEAAVVAAPDARWGQAPVAFVTLRANARCDEAELLKFCRLRLAAYKTPREIRFVESLPRNALGKLLRHELRRA